MRKTLVGHDVDDDDNDDTHMGYGEEVPVRLIDAVEASAGGPRPFCRASSMNGACGSVVAKLASNAVGAAVARRKELDENLRRHGTASQRNTVELTPYRGSESRDFSDLPTAQVAQNTKGN